MLAQRATLSAMTTSTCGPHDVTLVPVLLDDGRRVEGWLEVWRKDRDGWRGCVRYSTGLAETRLGWVAGLAPQASVVPLVVCG